MLTTLEHFVIYIKYISYIQKTKLIKIGFKKEQCPILKLLLSARDLCSQGHMPTPDSISYQFPTWKQTPKYEQHICK